MRQSKDAIHRQRTEVPAVERTRELGMEKDRAGRNDTTIVVHHLTPLAVRPCNARVTEWPTIDAYIVMDLDHLSGRRHNRLDQRRHAAGAEAEAQISTRPRLAHRVGVRWANEDQIADQDRTIGLDDPPQAQGLAWCEIDSKTLTSEQHNEAKRKKADAADPIEPVEPLHAPEHSMSMAHLHLRVSP